MTQQTFAEFLGVSPATLSGIFNERTRPTLALVEAIKKHIKGVNTDWLVLGEGPMYKDAEATDGGDVASSARREGSMSVVEDDIFSPAQSSQSRPNVGIVPSVHADDAGVYASRQSSSARAVRQSQPQGFAVEVQSPVRQRQITEIRVFYSDQTWETFVPKK